MNANGSNADVIVVPSTERAQAAQRRSQIPIIVLAILFALATFLTWYFTWFGRELSDADIAKYLADERHPRHVQHALLQIQQHLDRGDQNEQRWYPKIVALAGNSEAEFRLTAAWVMGFDNKSQDFHQALLQLVKDAEPVVRRNAALALVRFDDASGRGELLATLRPYSVNAPAPGAINSTLNVGSIVARGTLLARIDSSGKVLELRSPLPGRIEMLATQNGANVKAGDTMLTISSDANSVWEALRGLALIGQAEDLDEVGRYARGVDSLPARIKEQAALTAKAIQSRSLMQKTQPVTR